MIVSQIYVDLQREGKRKNCDQTALWEGYTLTNGADCYIKKRGGINS